MVFRVNLPMLLERPGCELSEATSVTIQLVFERGRWRAQCQEPPVATLICDSMEEALIAAAREITSDWVTEERVSESPAAAVAKVQQEPGAQPIGAPASASPSSPEPPFNLPIEWV